MADTTRSRAILATASRLFAEKGYRQTATSEIAREAKVAEGTLYHHFGSKDGIFLPCSTRRWNGYLAGRRNGSGPFPPATGGKRLARYGQRG